jgi:hypothetical protein
MMRLWSAPAICLIPFIARYATDTALKGIGALQCPQTHA